MESFWVFIENNCYAGLCLVIIVDMMTYVVKRIKFVIQLPSLIVGWDGGSVQVNTDLMVVKEAPFLCKGILTGANVA